jgi:hypothetical protein
MNSALVLVKKGSMRTVKEILFAPLKELPSEPSLFKGQLDLAMALVSAKKSPYYIPKEEDIRYQQEVGRRRSYIAQLFGSSLKRRVAPEFKEAMAIVLQEKIREPKIYKAIYTELLEAIDAGNNQSSKTNETSSLIKSNSLNCYQELTECYKKSRYWVYSGYEPIETLIDPPKEIEELIKVFIDSLVSFMAIDSVNNFFIRKRFYRYNVSDESSALIFWIRLRKLIMDELYLQVNNDEFVHKVIHNTKIVQDKLSRETIKKVHPKSDPFVFDKIEDARLSFSKSEKKILSNRKVYVDNLGKFASAWLEFLNYFRVLRIFVPVNPSLQVPIIVFNPEASHPDGFLLLNNNTSDLSYNVYKMTPTDLALWKRNYWTPLVKLIQVSNHENCAFSREILFTQIREMKANALISFPPSLIQK